MNNEERILQIIWDCAPGVNANTAINKMDSLGLIDIVMSVEEEFSIDIPDEALEHIKTIGDLVVIVGDLV